MSLLHIDFETRSVVDLKSTGIDVYASHPSTDIVCMAYAFDDGPVCLIVRGEPLPKAVETHVLLGGMIAAHNVTFEKYIWNNVCVPKYGWPKLNTEQLKCTMAMAYSMAIPGSLEKAAAAMGITKQKDMAGSRVMLQVAQPRGFKPDGSPIWWDDAEKLKRVYDYCKQDVEVERELDKRLFDLSSRERALWLLDQKINDRGVRVDIEAVDRTIKIVEFEQERLNAEMKRITKGAVSMCTATGQLTDWIRWQGVETEGVAKADVTALLNNPDLPNDVRRALELRREAAKSSTAKLQAMKNRASSDGRIRGMFQYHGANTGRWAGRGVQLHNLPRPSVPQDEIEWAFSVINKYPTEKARDLFEINYGSALNVVSDCLRGFLVPSEGKSFATVDFSAIEARVLAWLAGEEQVLEVFRTGEDIYKFEAANIYSKPYSEITKEQRQIGKVAVLALGYQGGKGAFQVMAKGYGVKVTDDQAETIKIAWREKRPKTVRYWYDVEASAISAVKNPGTKTKAGPKGREVHYVVKGSFLWCKLPSERVLCYPYPKVEMIETPWGDMKEGLTYMSEDSLTKKWERQKAYGGLLVENITQAVARDILADSLLRLDENNFDTVMHIHDEDVCEVDTDALKQMEEIMSVTPAWATGLPIGAEGWHGRRYRK